MAVRIRLSRMGKKNYATYRIVVVDSQKKRDGRAIEYIGSYNPNNNPSYVDINKARYDYWLSVGAQPSDTVKRLSAKSLKPQTKLENK